MKNSIQQGDKVRVIQYGGNLGETIWNVMAVDGFRCMIAEDRKDGKLPAAQEFDTSMLKKVS